MKMRLVLAALFAFLLVSQAALAVGISPGRIELKFVPNFNATYSFHVMNNENAPLNVQPFVYGDLAQYIIINKSAYTLAAGEYKGFEFQLNLPDTLDPGKRDTRLGVVGVNTPGGMVGAVAGVEMQFWVYVDYPEKYISVNMVYTEPSLDKPMAFDVTLFNPVNRTLTPSADLNIIEIRNGTEVTLERFDIGSVALKPGEDYVFHTTWTPKKAGDYLAVAHAYYEGATSRREFGFTVEKPQPPAVPSNPQTIQETAKKTAQNLLYSPYTAIIAVLVIAIIIVCFWPSKKKEGEKDEN